MLDPKESMHFEIERKVTLLALVLLFLVLVGGPVLSQENEPPTYRLNTRFLEDLKDDFVSVWAGPLEWGGRDWTKFAVAAAFSVATVIAHYNDSLIVDILSYGTATLVAFARPFQDKHWPTDVFFGAALGYYVGQKICARHSPKTQKNFDVGTQVTPFQQSLSFSFSF